MDEIIQLVCSKTGISEEQAKGAVDTVVGFLKDKMPAGIGDQVQGFISGGSSMGSLGDIAGGLGDKIGGMFGS